MVKRSCQPPYILLGKLLNALVSHHICISLENLFNALVSQNILLGNVLNALVSTIYITWELVKRSCQPPYKLLVNFLNALVSYQIYYLGTC